MTKKETNGVLASLQALGLIDEKSKVTIAGLDALTRYVAQENNNEGQTEYEEEWEPEYAHTTDMINGEIEEWAFKNHGIAIPSYEGGRLEITPTRFLYKGMHGKRWDKNEALCIVACNFEDEEEAMITIESKKDIIELRDYLTRFIEKDEDWYKIEENN